MHTLFEQKTTKHGLDKLSVMCHFIPVIESNGNSIQKELNRLKSFIVSQIKRGTNPQEELNLMQGILDYVKSDPGTNERTTAMDYLFDLKFLND